MRAPISVVIPTLNAEQDLPGCLSALIEGLEAGLIRELIVTDGGSGDATLAIAAAAGARVVTGPAGIGGQLRRGAAVAEGDWLFMLLPECWLGAGWTVHAEAALATPAAYWSSIGVRGGGLVPWMVAQWVNLRSRISARPSARQGLLLPYPLYETVGGYADQPRVEDTQLLQRLRGHMRPLGAELTVTPEALRARG